MTKFTPLSTYVFNVLTSTCYVLLIGRLSWDVWDYASRGLIDAALVGSVGLVVWGACCGGLYFDMFHGPLDRVAEKRFRLRQRRARRRLHLLDQQQKAVIR